MQGHASVGERTRKKKKKRKGKGEGRILVSRVKATKKQTRKSGKAEQKETRGVDGCTRDGESRG